MRSIGCIMRTYITSKQSNQNFQSLHGTWRASLFTTRKSYQSLSLLSELLICLEGSYSGSAYDFMNCDGR